VFVDANGDFYPDDWSVQFKPGRIEDAHSLWASRRYDAAVRATLEEEKQDQLAAIERLVSDKERVFILVHGFNNSEKTARAAFDAVRSRLRPTAGDVMIDFHWDGLVGAWGGQLPMWFNAAGYSQVAGVRALRPLLNRLRGKKVYLISHSRGASVVLSALADPAWDPQFREATEKVLGKGFLDGPPLDDNGNEIHALLMAPAVGKPDFWEEDCAAGCDRYRDFPAQLKGISYTVNRGDPILKKIFGGRLAASFNATDLGWDPTVGAHLRDQDVPLREPQSFDEAWHPFLNYACHASLGAMLKESGVSSTACPAD
jgi:pimeloyl-ACP methyl ester carboxylesterase